MATISWATDADGNFSTATNWKGGVVPGSSDEAFLAADGGAAYTVTLDVGNTQTGGITIGSIRSETNATLFLDNVGENSGTVDFLETVFDTNGEIDNVGYDVEAAGTIKGELTNDADGFIDAGYSTALEIDTKATVMNNGYLQVTGSGGLLIENTTVNQNGGGVIESEGETAKVVLRGTQVEGGTLFGPVIQLRGSGNVFDGSTNAVTMNGGVTVLDGAILTGEGDINNEGTDGRTFVVKGSAAFEGAVDNTGAVETAGDGALTVQGALSGGGEAVIDGGTMTFASSVAAKVVFEGSGELALGEAEDFSGEIQNFAPNGKTSLDLEDVGFAGAGEATFSGNSKVGVLTVVGANRTVQFELKGDYLGVTFITTSTNGGAGSLITASQTTETARFVQAAAAFTTTGASAASTQGVATTQSPSLPNLAAARG